jgi:transcriptional regulator with GAF, ATPase, and Fis domain
MRPRLVSDQDSGIPEIAVGTEPVTIGRDSANAVCLDDPVISSRHCQIMREGDAFVLLDRDSKNGTFVNGSAVARAALKHGDEIQIGHARFLFLIEEGSHTRASTVKFLAEEDVALSTQTVQLDIREFTYGRGVSAKEPQVLDRLAKDMSVLLRLSRGIHAISGAEELQAMLLDTILERIPAEYCAILLGDGIEDLSAVVERQLPGQSTSRISRAIVEQVVATGQAVLRNDLLSAEDTSQSIRAAKMRSILCVPLSVMQVRTGMLYISTSNPLTPFDERHLEMAAAVAGIGALALEHARYVEWLESENKQLAHEVNLAHGMIGENSAMKRVYEAISLIAPTNSPVLVLGETGTGKELAARAIHNNSLRRNGPFIPVNCGAVVDTLFASQLFGYVKGAFSGADRDRKGFIEEADGGTLFLDELGDLPFHCQAALLRVLEEGKVQRVGSAHEIPVDIRLISATNRSLKGEIEKGNFRGDLYFRMGLPLELPPLRERLDDIPLLVQFFLQKYKSSTQRTIESTHPDTIRTLQKHLWPGNVRELGRAIHWAVVFGKSNRLRPEDLPPEILKGQNRAAAPVEKLEDALEAYEKQLIARALEETRGNVVEAASLLGRAPNYLQRRISQLKLRDELGKIRTVLS